MQTNQPTQTGRELAQIVYEMHRMADALIRQTQILQNMHNLLQMRQANGK